MSVLQKEINLSFATLGDIKTLTEGFAFARDLGVGGVDLFPQNFPLLPGIDPDKPRYWTDRDLDTVANLAKKDYGLRIDCLLVPVGKSYFEDILDTIRAAARVGARYVLVAYPHILHKNLARLPELFAPLLKEARDSGAVMVVENEPFDGVSYDPQQMLKIFESVNSPQLRLCFDPCNLLGEHPEPFPRWYETLKGYIEKLHLKGGALFDAQKHPAACRHRKYGPMGKPEDSMALVPITESSINFDGIIRNAKTNPAICSYTLDTHLDDWKLFEACVRKDMKWLTQTLEV